MPALNTASNSSPKPDYSAPTFRGALTSDHWLQEGGPEFSTISTGCISEVGRASNAVVTIARIVHNSLSEPQMSSAEPLGHDAHLGLLDALEIIGVHLKDVVDSMHETSRLFSEHERVRQPKCSPSKSNT